MNTLLLNEKTIPTLARGFVQGVNNKVKMQDAITESMQAWIANKDITARDALQNLWAALEHNKKALAVLRSQYNTISKRVKKANGDENPVALTVTDGVLTEVVPRNKAGGGSGSGEGEGAITSTAAPSKSEIELAAHLDILRELLKNSKDVAATSALKFAIAKLAATV
jgi:hypothetical protein